MTAPTRSRRKRGRGEPDGESSVYDGSILLVGAARQLTLLEATL
jgi:hypothetical protein